MRRSSIPCFFCLAVPALAAGAVDVSRVADILPGPGGSGPSYLTVYDGVLYFSANSLSGGTDVELWRHDASTGAVERAADINPGPAGSGPCELAVYDDQLYFCASGPVGPQKLWRFDGAKASEAPGWRPNAQNPGGLIAYGSCLYFRAADFRDNLGIELWKYDGSTMTCFDMWPGPGSSYPQHMIEYNGLLYFNAGAAPGPGSELWRTNGTAWAKAATINPEGSSPECFAICGGKLYFRAFDGVCGNELWVYDGSTASLVADILPGGEYVSSNPGSITEYKGKIYFSAEGGPEGYELWCYDGEKAFLVKDINTRITDPPWADPMHHSNPADLTVFEDVLYFTADDGIHGRELWSFDGEEVALVADIQPGQYGSEPAGLFVYRDALYFRADDGQTGSELWQLRKRPEPSYLRGDSNIDGRKDLTDPMTTLGFIFLAEPAGLSCEKSADANDSGDVDISDAVFTLFELFRGTAKSMVLPSCCADETPDGLTCEVYTNCN